MSPKQSLVDQIEADALDSTVPLTDALRKCVLLGGRSGSTALQDWATRELEGYSREADLPEYRIVHAPLRIDGMVMGMGGLLQVTGQAIAPMSIPEFARESVSERLPLPHGVGDLEALARQGDIKLQPPHASDLVLFMNSQSGSPGQRIDVLYWNVAPVVIEGVLGHIRNDLVKLVAELRASMPSTSDIPPSEVADNALSFVVSGKRARVHVVNAQAASHGTAMVTQPTEDTPSRSWRYWGRLGAFVAGAAAVAGVAFAFLH
jgi:AbiTii